MVAGQCYELPGLLVNVQKIGSSAYKFLTVKDPYLAGNYQIYSFSQDGNSGPGLSCWKLYWIYSFSPDDNLGPGPSCWKPYWIYSFPLGGDTGPGRQVGTHHLTILPEGPPHDLVYENHYCCGLGRMNRSSTVPNMSSEATKAVLVTKSNQHSLLKTRCQQSPGFDLQIG